MSLELQTLSDWLRHLEGQHVKSIDMGLERVQRVADELCVCDLGCPVITVAGTNGKGSTVTTLTAIYQQAAYRVGTYTSPHIHLFNERIALNGQMVDDQTLIAAFVQVEAARERAAISLTYFEFTTLAAFYIFQQAKLDIVILEVGLGGRLDAVNIIDADVAVITSIGIDHTDWLGDTREAISREKAGIFRSQRPAICGDSNPPQPLLDYAAELAVPLQRVGQDYRYHVQENSWSWSNNQHHYEGLAIPKLAIANVATALAAVHAAPLVVDAKTIHIAIQQAQLAGRAERIVYHGKEIILDVAHNPHGAAFFMQQLPHASHRTLAVFAMLADKDIAGTLDVCLGMVDEWFIAGLSVPRGTTAQQLAPLLIERGMHIGGTYHSVAAAIRSACQHAQTGDRILVFGSFYTVAHAKQWLQTH
ncbi:bifunctional tetrahydrofolate synthase/dihydrofolate synthase [Agitococcus lubricus]|uniref:Dihydrofolate synthase/folylpolyglutamate synthase n=1 Tax=Agitococcus lubricus TaxID=1077255 RepID=A0A2T5IVQ2_9GAMM|nr:bifunctional tetrahydrofolate synthase/dihydrofolate synthase [Agitococcus lubricus]PTQ87957.1 dihydrofolate synthase/folylpolyglutamate synthase [Agitococcus lubricus]